VGELIEQAARALSHQREILLRHGELIADLGEQRRRLRASLAGLKQRVTGRSKGALHAPPRRPERAE
jgi:hypothetical protein